MKKDFFDEEKYPILMSIRGWVVRLVYVVHKGGFSETPAHLADGDVRKFCLKLPEIF